MVSPRTRARRMAALTTTFVLLAAGTVFGRSTSSEPFTAVQPDGTQIVLRGVGDEAASWYEDQNGYSVVLSGNNYQYATLGADGSLAPTGLMVGSVDPSQLGLARHLTPSSQFLATARKSFGIQAKVTTTGTVKMLVVPIKWSNHATRVLPTQADWNALFNTGERSLKNFFYDCSYGKLTLESVVTDWVAPAVTEAEAKTDTAGALKKALEMLDATGYNFKQFDSDNDGKVDIMTFLHSGYDGATSGNDADGVPNTQRIHSHAGGMEFTAKDGTRVEGYSVNAGLDGLTGGKQAPINTPCHEVGHVLGLPDLYDTDYTSTGAGFWSMMASSDGPGGTHVPLFDPWSRVRMGWATPTVISSDGTYQAKDVVTNAIFKIQQGFPEGEYLLIENRQPGKWETNLPNGRGGLMIWHVDEKVGSLDANNVNNSESVVTNGVPNFSTHYRVAVVQADGLFELEQKDGKADGKDMFRADDGGRTVLTPNSTPSSNAYQGGTVRSSNVRISEISVTGSTMTFKATVNDSPQVSNIPNVGAGAGSASGTTAKVLPAANLPLRWAQLPTADSSDLDGDPIGDFAGDMVPGEDTGPIAESDDEDPCYTDENGDGDTSDDDPDMGGMDDGGLDNPETINFAALGGTVNEFTSDDSNDDMDGDGVDDDSEFGYDFGAEDQPDEGTAEPYKGDGTRFVVPIKVSDGETPDPSKLKMQVASADQTVVPNSAIQIVPATEDLLNEARNAGMVVPEGANFVIIITPGTNAASGSPSARTTIGTTTIKFVVGDGVTRTSQSFRLNTSADANGDGTPDTTNGQGGTGTTTNPLTLLPIPTCGSGIGVTLGFTGLALLMIRTRRR